MEYNLFGCLFFGLFSGLSEFLPVSTLAHQYLFDFLTGFSGNDAYIRMMVYLGCLIAVIVCCRGRLVHIYRELRLASLPKRRRKRVPDLQAVSDFKLCMIALIPMVIGVVFCRQSYGFFGNLPMICVTLIISGVLCYLPALMVAGFGNSKNLTPMDGILLGVCSAVGVIPGISRMGTLLYAEKARHCGREAALELALLFAIPMMLVFTVFHLIDLLVGTGLVFSVHTLIAGIISAAAAFGGAVGSIFLMRYLVYMRGFSDFAYYNWGLSVFCFIFYLIT